MEDCRRVDQLRRGTLSFLQRVFRNHGSVLLARSQPALVPHRHAARFPETKLANATAAAPFSRTKVPAASATRARIPRFASRANEIRLSA